MDKQIGYHVTWLKKNRHLNKMYVHWLDEIEDFRFDVMHLSCTRNPVDQLTHFTDGPGPAASMGNPDLESHQELFPWLGCNMPCPAALAVIRAG